MANSETYRQFLADVADGDVWVSGMGAGAGEATVTVAGRGQVPEYREHLYRALSSGLIKIDGPRVVMNT